MADTIQIDDREKLEKAVKFDALEGRHIDVGRFGVVPNLAAFMAAVQELIDATKSGAEFEEYSDAKWKRLKGLAKFSADHQKLLDEYRKIDQAELDAGREQIFDSVAIPE